MPHFHFSFLSLAHERLSIVGLHSGAQPINNKSGDVSLSANGEIYNYLELKEQLLEAFPHLKDEFTTDSDCEVLLHLYKAHGHEFLQKVIYFLPLKWRILLFGTGSTG
jgi:asparagine synthase (glutamine-hydrolysing)